MNDGRIMSLRADPPTNFPSKRIVTVHVTADEYRSAYNLALHHKTSLAEAIRIAIRNEAKRESLTND
jgi:hypothetical protein